MKKKSIIAVLSAATLLLSFVACSSPSGGGSGSGSGSNSQNENKEVVENGGNPAENPVDTEPGKKTDTENKGSEKDSEEELTDNKDDVNNEPDEDLGRELTLTFDEKIEYSSGIFYYAKDPELEDVKWYITFTNDYVVFGAKVSWMNYDFYRGSYIRDDNSITISKTHIGDPSAHGPWKEVTVKPNWKTGSFVNDTIVLKFYTSELDYNKATQQTLLSEPKLKRNTKSPEQNKPEENENRVKLAVFENTARDEQIVFYKDGGWLRTTIKKFSKTGNVSFYGKGTYEIVSGDFENGRVNLHLTSGSLPENISNDSSGSLISINPYSFMSYDYEDWMDSYSPKDEDYENIEIKAGKLAYYSLHS